MSKIVLVGIGQALRGDDQVGLEVVNAWQAQLGQAAFQDVRVELAELPGLALLEILQGAQVAILIDAVQSGAAPGTIHLLHDNQWAASSLGSASAHGWGVAETIKLGRLLNPEGLPETILLVGIEAAQFEIGQPLSLEVKAAVPEAAALINQQIEKYR